MQKWEKIRRAVASLKQHPLVLLGVSFNIVSAVLCYPRDYPTRGAFYRAVVIYVINVFLTEIPRWEKQKAETRLNRDTLQVAMIIIGAILIGIGLLSMSQAYDPSKLPQETTASQWIYFGFAMLMLVFSLLCNMNLLDTIKTGQTTPGVLPFDPSREENQDGEKPK